MASKFAWKFPYSRPLAPHRLWGVPPRRRQRRLPPPAEPAGTRSRQRARPAAANRVYNPARGPAGETRHQTQRDAGDAGQSCRGRPRRVCRPKAPRVAGARGSTPGWTCPASLITASRAPSCPMRAWTPSGAARKRVGAPRHPTADGPRGARDPHVDWLAKFARRNCGGRYRRFTGRARPRRNK